MPILDLFEDVVQFHRPRGFESKFSVWKNANQAIVSGAPPKIVQFEIAIFDTLGEFDLATETFTPSASGYYMFQGQVRFATCALGTQNELMIFLDAVQMTRVLEYGDGIGDRYLDTARLLYLTPANGVTLRVQHNLGINLNIISNIESTFFEGFRVA